VKSSHGDDVELARRCAEGDDAAWERFVREYRPILYRAADAVDPTGGARDIADGLYGELYGTIGAGGERRSLFRYFHGRSSLATWLRAVVAQRFVDRVRARRRLEPLPDDPGDSSPSLAGAIAVAPADPDRDRLVAIVRAAVHETIAQLSEAERLLLGCYYLQSLTLAEIGRVLHEHEATVSRRLARIRRAVRASVEGTLRDRGLTDSEIDDGLTAATEDSGSLDLNDMLGVALERKNIGPERS